MNKDSFFEKIRKKVGHTLFKYQMISANDKILIALSGGKDSLVLFETLTDCKKHVPFNFDIYACHIFAKGVDYQINKDYLISFCKEKKVPLQFKEINVEIDPKMKKHPCFICSWHRRKKLFETCRELSCNKLAFGHHMDDAIETLFMNMIYHGSISSLPQKIDFLNGDIQVIRPLLHLDEKDINIYSDLKEFIKEIKSCKYEENTQRTALKKYIQKMELLTKQAKLNIFRSMDNIYSDYLPKKTNT